MKFSIERGALLKAVSQTQSVVERRNTIPILGNVLIEAENDKVSFRATDLDIEIIDHATLGLIILAFGLTTDAQTFRCFIIGVFQSANRDNPIDVYFSAQSS